MDITKRLEIKSNMIFMGEKIAFGSECELMDEAVTEIQQLRNRVVELEEANKLLTQWVGQLGVEARRIGVHVTINGLDYAATLRRLNKEMENKNDINVHT